MKQKIIGKVLWWDKKYGHGIVEDKDCNEYYIDNSVLNPRSLSETLKKGTLVSFVLNELIKDCRCGKDLQEIRNE